MPRLIPFIAGLLALLAMIACESFNATQTAEAPTKEAEKALEQKRKDAGLPSCGDMEDEVIGRANFELDTFGDVKGLDDQRLVSVAVDGDTPSITCSAKANLDNDFDGYTFIRYTWKKGGDGRLWVSVSTDTRRAREEATKEASER